MAAKRMAGKSMDIGGRETGDLDGSRERDVAGVDPGRAAGQPVAAGRSNPGIAAAADAPVAAKLLAPASLELPLPPSPISDLNGAANQVKEGAKAGDAVGITAYATDPNGGKINYSLLADSSGGGFAIDAKTGVIAVKDPAKLDYETTVDHQHKLTVKALDWDGLFSTKTFVVTLLDANEAPGGIADADAGADTVAENAAGGTLVGITAKAADPDAGNTVTYSLTDDAGGRFQINATTGVVSVKAGAVLDFEAAASHAIKVQAKDAAGLLSPAQSFTIKLGNVNEAPGGITDTDAAANMVTENVGGGTLVRITAKSADPDAGDVLTYFLTDDAGGRFQINATTGVVSVKAGAALDFETAANHAIKVQAKDAAGLLSPEQSFTIALSNANEAPSGIADANAASNTVVENAGGGTAVGITAKLTDPDAGDTATYALTDDAGGRFQIDAATGVVSVKAGAVLDFETTTSHVIKVQAKDAGGLFSPEQSFTIALSGVSEFAPGLVADANAAANTVAENAAAGTPVGITAKSTDLDAGDTVTYLLSDDAGGRFQIDAVTGVVSAKAGAELDFEAATSHVIKVQAKDAGGLLSPEQSFTIALSGVNEFTPGPVTDANAGADTVAENAAAGTLVGITAKSIDPDVGDSVTYVLSDDAGGRFQIDAKTGIVSVKAGAVLNFEAAASHAIKVQAKDAAGLLSPEQSFTIGLIDVNEVPGPIMDIDAGANIVTETGVVAGAVVGITAKASDPEGAAMSYAIIVDSSGGAFTIDAVTGVVSVINPTKLDYEKAANGQYAITVLATDAGGLSSTQIFTIDVANNADLVDLGYLGAHSGFVVQGDMADDLAGYSVSSAGDINSDGFADVVIGAHHGNDGGSNAGEAYVIFGGSGGFGADKNGRKVIDLTTLSAAQGFIIQGDAAGDYAGYSVATAGDVNGDGFADLIVGAPYGDDGGLNAGEAYVVFGGSGGFGVADASGRKVIDLTILSPAQGFVIQGDTVNDRAGQSVGTAGDLNGDGFADLVVGAPLGGDGGGLAGEAYVLFGGAGAFGAADANGRRVIDLTILSSAQGFIIQGDTADDRAGVSVGTAGDINGDGFADLIVGAYRGDDGGGLAGEVYVIFGDTGGFGVADKTGRQVIDLTTLSAAQGFIIQGDAAGDYAGNSVATAGDINGDGFADLIIGAAFGDDGGAAAGEAYVVFGGAGGFGVADASGRKVVDLTTLSPAQGFVIQGDTFADEAGRSASSAGDVNGDGFVDLIVGAWFDDTDVINAGKSYVVFGGAGGFGVADGSGRQVIDLTTFSPAQGFVIQGGGANDVAGHSASAAGDVNGDGFDDVIVGAPWGDDGGNFAGEAYVVFGDDLSSAVTHPGSANADSLLGTTGADVMIGGLGDDAIAGNGGADVIKGGGGNDAIAIADAGFFRIDGGGGNDALKFAGASGLTIAAGSLRARIEGIEVLDFANGNSDVVALSKADILSFDVGNVDVGGNAALDNVLRLEGNAGDSLSLTGGGWVSSGLVLAGYAIFANFANGAALVAVDNDFGNVSLS